MKKFWFLMLLLPFTAQADLEMDGMEGLANWYFHADFKTMRSTDSGRKLYAWLEDEVFKEVRREAGLDLDKDVDQIIAQSDGDEDMIFVINGKLRQEHKDQIMALAATQNVELLPRKAGRREYFFMEGDGKSGDPRFDDGAYFSFDLDDKLILTSSEDTMKSLLARNGRVEMRNKNAMIVLSAENAFMEAGMTAAEDAAWDSNIMKNTEEAALVIADAGGKVGFEAQLVSKAPEMAESLASIVRGLISLQVFNDELDPEIAELLKSTKVNVRDRTLSVSLALDPDVVVTILRQ